MVWPAGWLANAHLSYCTAKIITDEKETPLKSQRNYQQEVLLAKINRKRDQGEVKICRRQPVLVGLRCRFTGLLEKFLLLQQKSADKISNGDKFFKALPQKEAIPRICSHKDRM